MLHTTLSSILFPSIILSTPFSDLECLKNVVELHIIICHENKFDRQTDRQTDRN